MFGNVACINDVVGSITVAGAWSYSVVVTDDEIKGRKGEVVLGLWRGAAGEIVLARNQSASVAIDTLGHEFVHAWHHHVKQSPARLEAALLQLAESDEALRTT